MPPSAITVLLSPSRSLVARMTLAPRPAATSAAAQPAPPPPTISTSVLTSGAPAMSTSSIKALLCSCRASSG
jgi:hypothetical protein